MTDEDDLDDLDSISLKQVENQSQKYQMTDEHDLDELDSEPCPSPAQTFNQLRSPYCVVSGSNIFDLLKIVY